MHEKETAVKWYEEWKEVFHTCTHVYPNPPTHLRACDHGMGVEAQVQDCFTVM